MSTTTAATTAATTAVERPAPAEPAAPSLWRRAALAGLAAAVATTAIAALATRAGVPIEIEGEAIPLAGFAELTVGCTAIGALLARGLARWATAPRRTFVATTIALTGLSVLPDLTASAAVSTKAVLITTHVVAAAIVIPTVARGLPRGAR